MKKILYLPYAALTLGLTCCSFQQPPSQQKRSEKLETRIVQVEFINSNYQKPLPIEEKTINATQVKYLLNEMGASQLHPPLFSSEKPVIEISVGNNSFYVQAYDGNLEVSREKLEGIDIKISSSAEELNRVLSSDNVKESIKDSVSSKKINLELIASRIKLFSKGYMAIYNDFSKK